MCIFGVTACNIIIKMLILHIDLEIYTHILHHNAYHQPDYRE